MTDIWIYPGPKAFAPNADDDHDIIIFDVSRYYRPFFVHDDNPTKSRKFTPKEQGLPPFKGVADKILGGGFPVTEFVDDALKSHQTGVEVRNQEDLVRREARRVELAQTHKRLLEKGMTMTEADYYVERRRAFADTNRMKKDAVEKLQDEARLRNRIKMAKLRARRGQK